MKIIEGFTAAKKALSRETTSVSIPVSAEMRRGLRERFGTEEPEEAVRIILDEVRRGGDDALRELTRKIDGRELKALEVGKEEIKDAVRQVDKDLLDALRQAAQRIEEFHRRQRENIWREISGHGVGQQVRALGRVGVYVPGGTASYPSTVLMTAVPARVAGVGEVILTTPPGRDGKIPAMTLSAADIAGVDRVFGIGGAQAIGALAFGTETIPAVDKICGPGNIFVMLAKKQVFGTVAIDGLQGPSEVMIIADDGANPEYCAADILAQAEHDVLAAAVMVTTSREVAQAVVKELDRQLPELSRREMLSPALERGIIAVVSSLQEAVALANLYAPEHLCLMVADAGKYLPDIRNAGCIVAGRDATVVLGDYIAGPSHALPTGGTARFSSPLNVSDFIKYTSVVHVDGAMLAKLGPAAALIARAEGLDAHARAVTRRLKKA
ncbi:MAG: histidinol dehydrogenase [Chloroflexota bacterium]